MLRGFAFDSLFKEAAKGVASSPHAPKCDCGCVDLRKFQFEAKECQLYHSDDRTMCIPFYTSLLVRLVGAVLSVIYALILGHVF